jgi:hypothetical protein
MEDMTSTKQRNKQIWKFHPFNLLLIVVNELKVDSGLGGSGRGQFKTPRVPNLCWYENKNEMHFHVCGTAQVHLHCLTTITQQLCDSLSGNVGVSVVSYFIFNFHSFSCVC